MAGCGPISVAQIVCRHRYPNSHNGYMYHWVYMLESAKLPQPIETPSANQAVQDASQLISTIGQLMNAQYGIAGTSTNRTSVIPCFRALGYTNCGTLMSYNFERIMNSLQGLCPVWTRGHTTVGSGHAWVIDGYLFQYRYATLWAYSPSSSTMIKTQVRMERELIHCNWGWGGLSDGYFNSGVFDTSKRVIPDPPVTRSNYEEDQCIIVDIMK